MPDFWSTRGCCVPWRLAPNPWHFLEKAMALPFSNLLRDCLRTHNGTASLSCGPGERVCVIAGGEVESVSLCEGGSVCTVR